LNEPAKVALAADHRWDLTDGPAQPVLRPIEKMVRVLPEGAVLEPEIYAALNRDSPCRRQTCIVRMQGPDRIVAIGRYRADEPLDAVWFERDAASKSWRRATPGSRSATEARGETTDLSNAAVTVRPVTMQQLVVDGRPLGEPFVP
jgi:hypothetical protein